ncbi:unnamed protein product [Urochloa humidicola]
MATVRALSLALLLAFCFAACACAAPRLPTNRYISYAGAPRGRGQNSGGQAGCSVWKVRCPNPNRWGPTPTNAGATTAAAGPKGEYMSQAALPSDDKHQAPKKARAKTGAAGSKGRRYMRPAAMAADKPCDRPGCPSRP